jgi:hypothetical protein
LRANMRRLPTVPLGCRGPHSLHGRLNRGLSIPDEIDFTSCTLLADGVKQKETQRLYRE